MSAKSKIAAVPDQERNFRFAMTGAQSTELEEKIRSVRLTAVIVKAAAVSESEHKDLRDAMAFMLTRIEDDINEIDGILDDTQEGGAR